MANTPLYRGTTAVVAKGNTLSVDVQVDGQPVRYVMVTPSKAPDAARHQVGFNETTPRMDIPTVPAGAITPLEVTFTDPSVNARSVRSVVVYSDSAGTTFDIVAHV